MKTRLIFLLPLLWMLIGCSDSNSDSATLEISQSTFDNINSEGSIIKVSVTCNSTWRTISNQSWCIPNLQNGSNDGELVLTIHANTTSKERSATVTIYNPQIQISAESETKRSIFREKDKTKRSKKESAQHSKSRNKSFVMTSVSAL